ncbi:hypothetical protein PLESTM_002047600 [Pleodorina starrii]|nr:hypothetical protein PLESTM_002047600 [Pleodorina starrii]
MSRAVNGHCGSEPCCALTRCPSESGPAHTSSPRRGEAHTSPRTHQPKNQYKAHAAPGDALCREALAPPPCGPITYFAHQFTREYGGQRTSSHACRSGPSRLERVRRRSVGNGDWGGSAGGENGPPVDAHRSRAAGRLQQLATSAPLAPSSSSTRTKARQQGPFEGVLRRQHQPAIDPPRTTGQARATAGSVETAVSAWAKRSSCRLTAANPRHSPAVQFYRLEAASPTQQQQQHHHCRGAPG